MALRVASTYRTVSTAAIMVVAGVVPVHLMARSWAQLRRLQKNHPENARQIVDNLVWRWWQQEWEELTDTGQWTKRLIPDVCSWVTRTHSTINYHMTQFLTGNGCFQSYLLLRSTRVESPECLSCGDPEDDAEHTFFRCGQWARKLTELESAVGEDVTPQTKRNGQQLNGWLAISGGYEDRWNFPHCLGAMDEKHVVLQAPFNSGSVSTAEKLVRQDVGPADSWMRRSPISHRRVNGPMTTAYCDMTTLESSSQAVCADQRTGTMAKKEPRGGVIPPGSTTDGTWLFQRLPVPLREGQPKSMLAVRGIARYRGACDF
ncbi:hypothetical protein QTP88_019292 [Uroleucon formosanum]